MKFLIKAVMAISVCLSLSALAQTPDVSFGTGDLNGWTGGPTVGTKTGPYGSSGIGVATVNGTQTISCCGTNTWTISPYTGSYMVGMQPGSSANYSAMTTALGLSGTSITALNGQVASTGGSITSTAWISKDFTFSAGTTFKMAWVYTSTDYVPFNDGSLATLVNKNSATTFGTINGVSAQYILLGATNPGTGNYSTGSYGSTGWQQINYNITTAGDYKVGFGIFNQGDTALSPVLFVNDNLGTVNKNGTLFGAVASNDPTMPSGPSTPTPPTVTVTSETTTNSVTTTSVNGTSSVATAVAYGATATAIELANSRGAQTAQKLIVTQTTTVTNQTPVAITTTTTTPVTTTTTTTPVTVTVYSDGTSQTTNGTATVTVATTNTITSNTINGLEIDQTQNNKDYATRVDMYNELKSANSMVNLAMNSDPLSRSRVDEGRISLRNGKDTDFYVTGIGSQSNTSNTYSSKTGIVGFGYEKLIDPTLLVGIQYNHSNTTMSGDQAGGSFNKDMVGLYAVKTFDDWIVKGDVGVTNNQYNAYHTLNALALGNSSNLNGQDQWVAVRGYTPDTNGFRPFVGVRAERNQLGGATESGSAVSAMTYDPTATKTYSGEAGVAYYKHFDNKWSLGAEAGQTTQNVKTIMGTASYKTTDNTSVLLKVGTQMKDSVVNNSAQAYLRVAF